MSLRERQKLQTREHLLETAGRLFGEKGFAATSIDDIIGAAGTSRATLYAYFDSKDALLSAIVDRMWEDGQRYWDAFGMLADWSRGSLLGWLRTFAAAWDEDAPRNKAASIASQAIFLESRDKHRQLVAAVRHNKELWRHFPEAEAELRAAMVVNVVEGQFADFFFHGSSLDVEIFVGYMADALRVLLGAA